MQYGINLAYFDIQINFFQFNWRLNACGDYEKTKIIENTILLRAILFLNTYLSIYLDISLWQQCNNMASPLDHLCGHS